MDSRKMQWFLEQVNARRNPITEQQLDRFCRNPSGPILPEHLVETRRPHMDYGEVCTKVEIDLSGEPCYVIRGKTGRYRVDHGMREWQLANPYRPDAKGLIDTIINLGNDAVHDVTVIDFDRHNVPISRMEFATRSSSDGLGAADDLLFRGDSPLWNPHQDNEFPIGIDRQQNVFMTRTSRDPSGYKEDVTVRDLKTGARSTEIWFKDWKYFDQAFYAPDGALYVIGYYSTGSDFAIARCDSRGRITQFSNGVLRLENCEHRYEFVTIDDRVHLVCSRYRGGSFTKLLSLKTTERGEEWTVDTEIGENAYLRGLRRVKTNTWAYVGEPTRHGGECWFVRNEEQPAFRHVSRLFGLRGRWHYYGVTMDGQHICLMQLPT